MKNVTVTSQPTTVLIERLKILMFPTIKTLETYKRPIIKK